MGTSGLSPFWGILHTIKTGLELLHNKPILQQGRWLGNALRTTLALAQHHLVSPQTNQAESSFNCQHHLISLQTHQDECSINKSPGNYLCIKMQIQYGFSDYSCHFLGSFEPLLKVFPPLFLTVPGGGSHTKLCGCLAACEEGSCVICSENFYEFPSSMTDQKRLQSQHLKLGLQNVF